MTMQAIYDWIDANADECIKDLQTFVQQPSISAQNIGLRECATLIRDMMRVLLAVSDHWRARVTPSRWVIVG